MKIIQHNKQTGFSLIEIMLALSIGLILLMALSSLFITANELSKDRDVLAEVDEKARLVFDYIGNDLSRAGYVDIYDTPKEKIGGAGCTNNSTDKPYIDFLKLGEKGVIDVFARSFRGEGTSNPEQMTTIGYLSCGYMQPVIGCKGDFSKAPSRSEKINSNCSNTGKETEQSIRLAYQVASMGSVGTLKDNTSLQAASALKDAGVVSENSKVVDCSGEEIKDDDNGFVINEYSLKDGSLQCRGNSGKDATPMVLGVEELSFRYLITPPEKATTPISLSNSGKAVASYNTADNIKGTDGSNTLEWAGVVGVEICIVVAAKTSSNSFAIGLSNTQGDKYRSCERDSDSYKQKDKTDKRYYRRYIRTFAIPNTIYATKGNV